MAYVYLSLDPEFLERTKKEAIERGKEVDSEDPDAVWEFEKAEIVTAEIEDNEFKVDFQDGDAVFVSVHIPLDDDILENLIGYAIKRLNKFKTLLEAAK